MTALCSGFDDLPYSAFRGAFEAPFCMPRVRRGYGRGETETVGKRRAGAHCVPGGTPAVVYHRRVPAAKPPERAPLCFVYEPTP